MKVYVLRKDVLKKLAVDRCASVERAVLCVRGSADCSITSPESINKRVDEEFICCFVRVT